MNKNPKRIKIKFTDWHPTFDEKNNFITKALQNIGYELVYSDNPDYLFYSAFGYEFFNYDCIRVFFTGENMRPDFNMCDYAMAFDHMKFGDRYLRYPLFLTYEDELNCVLEHDKGLDELSSEIEKASYREKKFCCFMASQPTQSGIRENFVEKLNNYQRVDCGGKILHNISESYIADKISWQQNYKLCIAFENTKTDGYTTEKILQAYASGTVPVYWGNSVISRDFNPNTFVDYSRFDSEEDLIMYLIKLSNDPQTLYKMHNQRLFSDEAYNTILRENYLEDFLQHIIDQPLDLASRRTKDIWWAIRSESELKELNKIKRNFIYKIYDGVCKLLKK